MRRVAARGIHCGPTCPEAVAGGAAWARVCSPRPRHRAPGEPAEVGRSSC